MPEAVLRSPTAEDNAPLSASHGRRSGPSRRETRHPPASFATGGPEPPVARSSRLRAGEAARVRRSVDEHEARASVRERAPSARRKAHVRNAKARLAALGSDEARVFESGSFGVQKSIGRMADRDARRRYQAPCEYARSSSKEDAGGARRAPRHRRASESMRGPHDMPSNHGGTQGSRCARKPRRDRTRRGAGSGTREVQGPRARRQPIRRKGVRVVDTSL